MCFLGAMNQYGSEGPVSEDAGGRDLSKNYVAQGSVQDKVQVPRPNGLPFSFDNVCHAGWGNGSCWINAALQFFFSAEYIREELWERGVSVLTSFSRGLFEDPAAVEQSLACDSLKKIRRVGREERFNDNDLALLFCSTMGATPSSNGISLKRDRPG